MRDLVRTLGVLRSMLAACTLLIIACSPFADGRTHMDSWRFVPAVLAPSLMLLFLFVLPLDMTMSRIFMQDAPGAERARFRTIIRVELLLLILMVLAWLPFTVKILRG